MGYTQSRGRYVPASTWSSLSWSTMRLVTTVTVLALTASMALASMGIPEDVMLVALGTVAVLAVGLALVRLFVYLERNGVPLFESDIAATA
ncbi:hypothetical protein CP556_11150 [Natrinema sp. CBA1119]|uniref:hypothetical protein n=1 Tax=Natrinema sp. CBA1119 TaxID=1608465 RepID=UPI000BF38272|nr:hypothetical protein [Natrinema sp. CBA1119]PGF16619.1 hypothetical protein CP556_11150 [Natrinema sp. CBA1119]